MLIDASHPEETRVAIVDGNQVEEFDYESSSKKQLKGSIYLAKVTRVEPSLQAAFVDYGGNRHGFLAFSEIHPDYYQIPVADREALIAEEAAANADLFNDELEKDRSDHSDHNNDDLAEVSQDTLDETDVNKAESVEIIDDFVEEIIDDKTVVDLSHPDDEENGQSPNSDFHHPSDEDDEEKLRIKMAKRLRYKYKIQEVIKKNQIILVQVVKEERGNKGAALTTYLSLPGRYCVLMPNTLHGGGVSRKIANLQDRKKLKSILNSLDMPKGHACIIRTAGNNRTKVEIKRDYDYLKRMWETIRELTLKSIAPALIYEEGNLIKRSIRDLYTRDISEILVEGPRGYKTAKDFMRMLMPSHAKKIKNYENSTPLFQRYRVENHLDSMYSPTAQLKSGGYIVINPTEALVSIDVNSGRATKEHNIEETAVKTNLEAAEEIARQLKLRDMAGLIVIDFIDMEDQRNNRAVERKMKTCLKSDRARIQVGRISSFGLMEMSRQRLRVGVLESSTTACPHCEGSGLLRSVESQSLHILRVIEEEGMRAANSNITVYLPSSVAVYILNNKRHNLVDLEQRYDFTVAIAIDNELTASAYKMEKSGSKQNKTAQNKKEVAKPDQPKTSEVSEEEVVAIPNQNNGEGKERPRRRRRRRRNHPYSKNNDVKNNENTEQKEVDETAITKDNVAENNDDNAKPNQGKSERSSRRRRSRRNKWQNQDNEKTEATAVAADITDKETGTSDKNDDIHDEKEEKVKRKPRRTHTKKDEKSPEVESVSNKAEVTKEEKAKPVRKKQTAKKPAEPKVDESGAEDEKPKKRAPRKRKSTVQEVEPSANNSIAEEAKPVASDEAKPKKKGWWQRALS